MKELGVALGVLAPHLVSVALCSARLIPIGFLCPLLGGQAAPSFVKLGVVLSLALCLHVEGGVAAPDAGSLLELGALALKEFALGTVIGLVAAVPFDAARVGGRFIDLFRGTSAEAALPGVGSRESATGDLLHQLLVALAASGLAMPWLLGAVFSSFRLVPLGGWQGGEGAVLEAVRLIGGAFGSALAIGAPIAGLAMAADCLVGLASRAAPQMGLQELGAPLKILGGGAVLWLSVGLIAQRLLGLMADNADRLRDLLGAPL